MKQPGSLVWLEWSSG